MNLINLMKDERVKHRLTGVIVILSIAIIFVPAMIKKSNQRLGENINVSIKLPPKPILPKVAMVQEKAVFEAIKVAHVEIPALAAPPASTRVASRVPASIKPVLAKVSAPTRVAAVKAPVVVAPPTVTPPAVAAVAPAPIKDVKVASSKEPTYVVQLASFSQESNAESLVTRLRSKGYKANYSKMQSKQGHLYKVVVAEPGRRDDAQLLQKKLADSLQLKGFIVKTGVS